MSFANITKDTGDDWLGTGIAETVTGDLRALGQFRVVDRGRVIEAIRRTNVVPIEPVRAPDPIPPR